MGSEGSTVRELIQERLDDETLFFDSIVMLQESDGSVLRMAKAEEILEGTAEYIDYEVLAEDKDDDDVFIIVCEKVEV